ncbi:hypothetical protein [Rhizobium phage RHph_X2_24]|nr:hypothetical protein [Rhizobium phage RHph_X2_24]
MKGNDKRPANCRYRLHDEGKPYPRSSCNGCNRTVLTGLPERLACDTRYNAPARVPPREGYYKDAAAFVSKYRIGYRVTATPINAAEAREAAHLLNQLAEYLDDCKETG